MDIQFWCENAPLFCKIIFAIGLTCLCVLFVILLFVLAKNVSEFIAHCQENKVKSKIDYIDIMNKVDSELIALNRAINSENEIDSRIDACFDELDYLNERIAEHTQVLNEYKYILLNAFDVKLKNNKNKQKKR